MKETLKLERGLVLIRYVAPTSGEATALIRLGVAAGEEGKGDMLLDPMAVAGELIAPGQCAVVQCRAPLRLDLAIRSRIAGELPRGSVRVEYLTRTGGPISAPSRAMPAAVPSRVQISPATLNSFSCIGHVAYRGDVSVTNGAWLCGPDNPNRIEGIRLDWPDRPAGLTIAYRLAGSGASARNGEYAGSRGRSAPITGLEIWLEGEGAEQLRLRGEALFVHGGARSAEGDRIALNGAAPRDELIGLRLRLDVAEMRLSDDNVTKISRQNERVHIFRVEEN